jgi:hypothetical protein
MVDTGAASNIADGVPAYGGTPYHHVQTVYATADAGLAVNTEHVLVRNMNDVKGSYVTLDIQMQKGDKEGSFSTRLQTVINGSEVEVLISGRALFEYDEDGNIISMKLMFDKIPVPLQVDVAFTLIETNQERHEPDPLNPTPPSDDAARNGTGKRTGTGLPQTSDTRDPRLFVWSAITAALGLGSCVSGLLREKNRRKRQNMQAR